VNQRNHHNIRYNNNNNNDDDDNDIQIIEDYCTVRYTIIFYSIFYMN
jgi:hypothetical protein